MSTLRQCFHELGNWQNKISLAAITSKEMLELLSSQNQLPEDSKATLDKVIKYLNKIDSYILGTDKLIESFKPFLYSKIDPEIIIPAVKPKKKGLR